VADLPRLRPRHPYSSHDRYSERSKHTGDHSVRRYYRDDALAVALGGGDDQQGHDFAVEALVLTDAEVAQLAELLDTEARQAQRLDDGPLPESQVLSASFRGVVPIMSSMANAAAAERTCSMTRVTTPPANWNRGRLPKPRSAEKAPIVLLVIPTVAMRQSAW
ncbi:hypothetical protein, partial [Nonomuraea recticatena]